MFFVNNLISKITDKYGNYIEYETYTYNDNVMLSRMNDSFGRVVTFGVQNNNDIVITLPNGSTAVLDIATMTSSEDSDAPGEDVTVLAGITRNAGDNSSVSSYYSYTLYDGNTYNTMYSYSTPYYPTALLTCGINTQGAINRYYYETTDCTNYDRITYTAYRIVGNSINDSFDSPADYITYTYEGNHTGYTDENYGYVGDTYSYSVWVQDMNESTKYDYSVSGVNFGNKSYSLVKQNNYNSYNNSAYSTVTSYFTEGMSYPSTVITEYPGLDSKTG